MLNTLIPHQHLSSMQPFWGEEPSRQAIAVPSSRGLTPNYPDSTGSWSGLSAPALVGPPHDVSPSQTLSTPDSVSGLATYHAQYYHHFPTGYAQPTSWAPIASMQRFHSIPQAVSGGLATAARAGGLDDGINQMPAVSSMVVEPQRAPPVHPTRTESQSKIPCSGRCGVLSCTKKFGRESSVKRHVKETTEPIRYCCAMCSCIFGRSNDRTRHVRVKHYQ